ncbi:hypothetical protein [Rhodococcus tibetensis]|uniref:DUF222 domain-containing protein n=1 Tax=Rhodococcus tibetensis TaxID=2965064 RepID=A0ABT1QH22_9NOCA|nr:hypothetical protein [Rhodococcus sp. FXJ9.536]MCQ4120417.1 hypothetical protein [Rhodococcus sp. FXJ9.536]
MNTDREIPTATAPADLDCLAFAAAELVQRIATHELAARGLTARHLGTPEGTAGLDAVPHLALARAAAERAADVLLTAVAQTGIPESDPTDWRRIDAMHEPITDDDGTLHASAPPSTPAEWEKLRRANRPRALAMRSTEAVAVDRDQLARFTNPNAGPPPATATAPPLAPAPPVSARPRPQVFGSTSEHRTAPVGLPATADTPLT